MKTTSAPYSMGDESPDLLLLEGGFLVERAMRAGLELLELACVPARRSWAENLIRESPQRRFPVRLRVLPEGELADLAGYRFHRGLLALARRPPERGLEDLARALSGISTAPGMTILALPETRDPENLGSIFRSAAALGCSAILLGPGGPDPLSRRVLRVGMGAPFTLPWARLKNAQDLQIFEALGFQTAACVLDAEAIELRNFPRPERLLLCFGDEASGLSAPWKQACGARLTLPMRGGTDSLNVGVAAALFLYELACRDR